MSWVFAIFTEIGSNFLSQEEQQSWRPHGPIPSITLVVSRAPIWRISMRARNSRARSRTSSLKSTRSSALNRTVTRRPSGWMSTSTTFRWRLFCRARSWQVTTARLSRSRRSRQSLASDVVAFRITFRNRRSRLDSGSGRLGRRTSPMAVPVAVSTTQKSPTWRSNSSTRYSSAWSGSRSLIPIRYRGLISTVGVSVSIAIL